MKIGLFQMDVAWREPAKNMKTIKKVCQEISGSADLLVLPEMFSTGYVLDTTLLNPEWQHDVIRELTSLGGEYDLVITGSIPFFNLGRWFNTMITVDKTGLIHQYDKIQLFSPAGENKFYKSGHTVSVWSLKEWAIMPLICYDLRFPYLSFSEELPHLLVYAANWPISRIHHWETLLKARAIENQCYVVGINRVGKDENGNEYPGHSSIYDSEGNLISFAGNEERLQICELSMDKLTLFRDKWPFYKDRRKDFL